MGKGLTGHGGARRDKASSGLTGHGMAGQTFSGWLKEQIGRNDPVGDLAYDAKDDKNTPRGNASFYTWQKYLLNYTSRSGLVMQAFYQAWSEYEPGCKIMELITASELLQQEFDDEEYDALKGWWVEGIDQNQNIFTETLDAESSNQARKIFLANCKKWMPKAKMKITYLECIETANVYRDLSGDYFIDKPCRPTLRKRFRVMRRDDYRCQLCGRDADDGIKLEIDHKIPKSRGGSNKLENLWTLCFDCNRGKADSLL